MEGNKGGIFSYAPDWKSVGKRFHIEKNSRKARHWWINLVCSKYSWGSGGSHNLRKFCNFFPHLSLETVFQALKRKQNFYINKYEHFFSLKIGKLGLLLCLECYPHNLTKYPIKGTSKTSISQLYSELEKIWKCNIDLYSKKPIFHLFHELEKIENSRQKSRFWVYGWTGKSFKCLKFHCWK